MRKYSDHECVFEQLDISNFQNSGCDPLTPDDIAETIVFAAGRRENVVVADTLLFPNHQASATIMHRRGP